MCTRLCNRQDCQKERKRGGPITVKFSVFLVAIVPAYFLIIANLRMTPGVAGIENVLYV